jgi:hypothetical protein
LEPFSEDRETFPRDRERGKRLAERIAAALAHARRQQRLGVTASAERHGDHGAAPPEEPDHLAHHDRVVLRLRHRQPM